MGRHRLDRGTGSSWRPSAEAARLKAELRGYTVLEVWPDDSTQAVSF